MTVVKTEPREIPARFVRQRDEVAMFITPAPNGEGYVVGPQIRSAVVAVTHMDVTWLEVVQPPALG